jgi:1-aminocyclopropane-1-carboxylate deaminase
MQTTIENAFQLWIPSPLQPMHSELSVEKDIRLFVKRDDLIHYHISGNKYRKLKYNLQAFYEGDFDCIVAFGGAFSNLLYTLSYIGKACNIPMTFFVRGDGDDPNNPSLQKIKNNGAKLHFLSRKEFKSMRDPERQAELVKDFNKPFIIPEGGSNALAIPGSKEILLEIIDQLGKPPDYLLMDLGTAGTFSGVLSVLPKQTQLIGIPVLKGVDWIRTIEAVFESVDPVLKKKNFKILENYHFGGFAKYNDELIEFINTFTLKHGIPMDPIYTGKLAYAFMDLLKSDYFKPGSTVVWVHAGGLQGIDGFNYLNGNKIDY